MRSLFTVLPGLACAGGMAVMMWMMNRSSSAQRAEPPASPPDADAQLAELREEVDRLRGEIGAPTPTGVADDETASSGFVWRPPSS